MSGLQPDPMPLGSSIRGIKGDKKGFWQLFIIITAELYAISRKINGFTKFYNTLLMFHCFKKLLHWRSSREFSLVLNKPVFPCVHTDALSAI